MRIETIALADKTQTADFQQEIFDAGMQRRKEENEGKRAAVVRFLFLWLNAARPFDETPEIPVFGRD